jgi:protein O-GlcNAc transferase
MLPWVLLLLLAGPDGIKLYQERQFAAAESAFRRALAARPEDGRTRLYLAKTLIEQGRVPEALAEVQRALGEKADPELQFAAGKIMRDLAERRFASLERLAPESAAVREFAGRRFELQGKLPEALREYRAAIAKDPARPGLHFKTGNILWRMRELGPAAEELETELARAPHHGMANLRLGQVLLARDQAEQSLPLLEHAVLEMPDSPTARRELGKAYRNLGRIAEARREWEAVAKLRPDDDQVHYLLASLYRQLGEAERSRREFEHHREILERRSKRD